MSETASPEKGLSLRIAAPVLLLTMLIGTYFLLRYDGLWTENDTAALTRAMRSVQSAGHLIPERGNYLYQNGYAYQAIGALLSELTGLRVDTLQQLVLPFGIVLLAVPAVALFYEVTGSRRLAVMASILLFTQPEFLFVVLRGSHEKFGRLLMILALFLLFRSFKTRERVGSFMAYVSMFYLVLFGMLAMNFLVNFSFVFALAFGLAAGVVLERFRLKSNELVGSTTQRLVIIAPLGFILAFLIMFYFYPPVQDSLRAMGSAFGQTRALLLGNEQATNVYDDVLGAWVHPSVYVLVSLPNWLMMIGSMGVWVYQGVQWVILRRPPRTRAGWLLWLLYGAFGFQAMLSLVTDASGAFNNLQYRLFPTFVLLGVGMIIDALGAWLDRIPRSRIAQVGLSAAVFLLALFSMVKATNEASLVNYWVFYRPPELRAMQWFDANASESMLWVGASNRLTDTFIFHQQSTTGNYVYRTVWEDMPYILNSTILLQQSARTGLPLPDTSGYYRFYDNGMTQLYKRRPVTPYQR